MLSRCYHLVHGNSLDGWGHLGSLSGGPKGLKKVKLTKISVFLIVWSYNFHVLINIFKIYYLIVLFDCSIDCSIDWMIDSIFSHCYVTLHACFRSVCLLVDPSVVKVFSKIFATILAFQSFSREVDFWLNHHGQPNGWSNRQTKPFFRVAYPQQRTQVCTQNKERVYVWTGQLASLQKKCSKRKKFD